MYAIIQHTAIPERYRMYKTFILKSLHVTYSESAFHFLDCFPVVRRLSVPDGVDRAVQ